MNAKNIMSLILVGLLSACGKEEPPPVAPMASPSVPEQAEPKSTTPQPEAPAQAEEKPEAAPQTAGGEAIYKKTCALCHSAGVGGAPIAGNAEAWKPRIAQGMDVLYKHAIDGFTGEKGMMPARGGNANLTDDEVKAAVDFMASGAK